MGLETAYTTDELNMAFPASVDMVSQGDDHLRLLKLVLRNEFYQLYKKTRKYSFEKGNIVLAGQMLFYEAESQYYEWQGTYPVGGLVIPAGSTPTSAGGVGSGKWAVGKANGVASAIVMSDTIPPAPTPGLLWLDTTIGILFVYFDDGSSFQWIECYNPAIGVMSGAEVVRFLYEQYAASIGYTLLAGSIESGAVFTEGNSELVWHQATGNVYKCTGGFVGGVYNVVAGSNPTADSNLVLVTDSLRTLVTTQGTNLSNSITTLGNTLGSLVTTVNNLSNLLTRKTKKGGITQTLVANSLTFTQVAKYLNFKGEDATDGTVLEVDLQTDLSLTLPQGCTLGIPSGVMQTGLLVALYNDGSPVLAIQNMNSNNRLDSGFLTTTSATAISASATSADVLYAPVAVSNSPYVVLGQVQLKHTAGSWTVKNVVETFDTINMNSIARRQTTKPQTLTGVFVDSPAIPSWCKKVAAVLNGASLSGTALMLFRAIDSTAAVISSGYVSVGFNSTSTAVSNLAQTTGFSFSASQTAAGIISGKAEFLCDNLQSIVCSIEMVDSANTTSHKGGGKVTLSNTLSNIRVTSSNGTDTFDAGTVYFIFEG